MSRCGIELTSNDPALLSFLVKYPASPSWDVIEVEEKHYLISPNFQSLTSPQEVWQAADNLLFVLNGIMKLKFKSAILGRGSTVAYFDENDQLIRATGSRDISTRLSLSGGEPYYQVADAQHPSSIDIWLKAQNSSVVLEALQHYSNQLNWFNLYKVYEVIKKDTTRLERNQTISRGTFDKLAGGRRFDFEESANKERHHHLDTIQNQEEPLHTCLCKRLRILLTISFYCGYSLYNYSSASNPLRFSQL
jgi:hypothetical protein